LDERIKKFRQNMKELKELADRVNTKVVEETQVFKVADPLVTVTTHAGVLPVMQHKISFMGVEDLSRNKHERLQEVGEIKMRKLFNSFDADGGGTISQSEFIKACKNLRLNFDEDELSLFFIEFDEDQNQSLDFGEFTALVKNLRSKARI
jgi:hypothetical protein